MAYFCILECNGVIISTYSDSGNDANLFNLRSASRGDEFFGILCQSGK